MSTLFKNTKAKKYYRRLSVRIVGDDFYCAVIEPSLLWLYFITLAVLVLPSV